MSLAAAPAVVRLPVWRARFVLIAFVAGFAVLVGRSVYLQAMKTDFLQEKGEARFSRVLEIPATRGRVLDRNGEALAVSTPVKSIWVIPADVEASAQAKRRLAQLLGLDAREVAKKLAETDRDFVYLKRQVSPDTAEKVDALGIPGVYEQKEYRRYYPAGEVAAHLVGFTGVDDTGQEGIELAYQSMLGGKPGSRSEKILVRTDGTRERLPSKIDEVKVESGDMLVYRTAGGGGWKDPLERPFEKVEADVAKGLVSEQKAFEDYGVVAGDAEATEKHRAHLRELRGDVLDFDLGPELDVILHRAKEETGLEPPVPPEPLAWAPMESAEDALRRVRELGDRQMTQTE